MRLSVCSVHVLATCAVTLLLSSGCDAPAATSRYGTGPGPTKSMSAGAERGPVLEAVDAAVEDSLDQPVELSVVSMSIRPPFAAVTATPLDSDGDPIDYSKIPAYAGAVSAGALDDQVITLLEKTDSQWQVLEYEIGSTDFPGQEWAKAHGAPEDIFQP